MGNSTNRHKTVRTPRADGHGNVGSRLGVSHPSRRQIGCVGRVRFSQHSACPRTTPIQGQDQQPNSPSLHFAIRRVRSSGSDTGVSYRGVRNDTGVVRRRFKRSAGFPNTSFYNPFLSRNFIFVRAHGRAINFSRNPGLGKCRQRDSRLLWWRTPEIRAHPEVDRKGRIARFTRRSSQVRLTSPSGIHREAVQDVRHLPEILVNMDSKRIGAQQWNL